MKMISVIIPVYNSELYLGGCLDSIRNQTYSDFEVILVDDGSTDKSGELCDHYCAQDERFQVIHKKNSGAGAARNDGLSKAKGDYIVFVDSDDKLVNTYFEQLSTHDEDVVFIDVEDVNNKGEVARHEYMSIYKHLTRSDFLRCQMTGMLPWGGVRKCVKRNLITVNNICYSNHKIGEEAIYSFKVLRYAKSVGFIEGTSYLCLLHSDSLSQTKLDDPLGDVALNMRQVVKEVGDYAEFGSTVNAFIKVAAAVSVYNMAQNYNLSAYKKQAENRLKKLNEDLDSSQDTDALHISKRMRVVIWLMEKKCWLVIWLASRIRR